MKSRCLALFLAVTLLAVSSSFARFVQQGPKLIGAGAEGNSRLGGSVSLSYDGNIALIGGVTETSLWVRSGETWSEQAKLPGCQTSALSADGQTAILGTAGQGGMVWVRNGDGWIRQGPNLVGSGALGDAAQGNAVAISADGNTALVAGYLDDSYRGAVWVWYRSGSVWTEQVPKLVSSETAPNSYAGSSVALSADGRTAIIGSPFDGGYTGAVWVWAKVDGIWTQQSDKMMSATALGSGSQGISVALSADGNTAMVGAPLDNGNANQTLYGAAWIWTRTAGKWREQRKLVGTSGGYQGYSVSLAADGNNAIVGGAYDSWIWSRKGDVWTEQEGNLRGTDTVGFPSGKSVAMSGDGNTAIVGERGDNRLVGAAWIWTRNGESWAQQGPKLVGANPPGADGQGSSVALSADGNTAIVAGLDAAGRSPAAWIWARSAGGAWTAQSPKLLGSGTGGLRIHVSVALSADGNTAIVGSDAFSDRGAVWVWTRTDGVWTQQGERLTTPDRQTCVGQAVALSADGNTVITGAPCDHNSSGAAWVWTRSGGVWTLQGSKLSAPLSDFAAQGTSVALSADGNTAIIGGPGEGGAAWVWIRTGDEWTQQGPKLNGASPERGGGFGQSVGLSANGNTAVIGGARVGGPMVWTRSGGVWTKQDELFADNAWQGISVAISGDGNTAVVGGSPNYDTKSGAGWVWTRSRGRWTNQGPIEVSGSVGFNALELDHVAISSDGRTIIIGGAGDDNGIGAAWIFADQPDRRHAARH